jgi:hypothetical protein
LGSVAGTDLGEVFGEYGVADPSLHQS